MTPLKLAFESIQASFSFFSQLSDKYGAPHPNALGKMVSWICTEDYYIHTFIQFSPLTSHLFWILIFYCLQDVVTLGWSSGQTQLLSSRQKAWLVGCTIALVLLLYPCLTCGTANLSVPLRWNLSITLFPVLHPSPQSGSLTFCLTISYISSLLFIPNTSVLVQTLISCLSYFISLVSGFPVSSLVAIKSISYLCHKL